jgi:hypothetical protein
MFDIVDFNQWLLTYSRALWQHNHASKSSDTTYLKEVEFIERIALKDIFSEF